MDTQCCAITTNSGRDGFCTAGRKRRSVQFPTTNTQEEPEEGKSPMARLRHLYARTRTERAQAEKTRVEMHKVRFHQLVEQGNLQNVQSRVPPRLPINNARWFRSTIPTDAGSFSSSVQESYKCGRPGQELQAPVDASGEGVCSGMEEVQSQYTECKWRDSAMGVGCASRSSTNPRECASSEENHQRQSSPPN